VQGGQGINGPSGSNVGEASMSVVQPARRLLGYSSWCRMMSVEVLRSCGD
jgi:hypothetical protein